MRKTKMYFNTCKSDSTQTLSDCDSVPEEQAYLSVATQPYISKPVLLKDKGEGEAIWMSAQCVRGLQDSEIYCQLSLWTLLNVFESLCMKLTAGQAECWLYCTFYSSHNITES